MSQDLAQEARAAARVENTRKTAVIASDHEVGRLVQHRRKEEAGIVPLGAAQDLRGERSDIPGAGHVLPALIDSADR